MQTVTRLRHFCCTTKRFHSTTMSAYLEAEKKTAISAVLKASAVAQRVQADLIDNEKATKSDNSPVTGEPSSDFNR